MVRNPALHATLMLVFGLLASLLPAQEIDRELFEKSIRPILVERCVACHNPAVLEGGLDLTSAAGFAKGATTGPLLNLLNLSNNPLRSEAPERSRLLAAISYEGRVKMPPDGRLAPNAIEAFRTWVEMGAPWPDAEPASVPSDVEAAFHEGTKELLGVPDDERSGSAGRPGVVAPRRHRSFPPRETRRGGPRARAAGAQAHSFEAGDVRPHQDSRRPQTRFETSSPTTPRRHLTLSLSGCSLRRAMASAGAGTGWM